MLEYTGTLPVLYRGPKRQVTAVLEDVPYSLEAQALVQIERRQLQVSFNLFTGNDELAARLYTPLPYADPFRAYRTARILQVEPVMTRTVFADAANASCQGVRVDNRLQRIVGDRIGSETFGSILYESPPNVIEALRVLKEAGARLDTDAIADEVRQQRLKYTQTLAELGIEDPKVIDQRARERKERVQKYEPAVRKFLATLPHVHEGKCGCVEVMLAQINDALDKGIEREDILLGGAITDLLFGLKSCSLGSMFVVLQMIMDGPTILRESRKQAAEYLAKEYNQATVLGYAQLLTEAEERQPINPRKS